MTFTEVSAGAGISITVGHPDTVPTPAPAQLVVGRIPREPTDFVARRPLQQLRSAVMHSAVVAVVTGMRGVGKTQLAAAYAREVVAEGRGMVAWVDAETGGTLIEGLAAVARRLGVHDPQGDSHLSACQLRDYLSGCDEPGLLVLDNATSPDLVSEFLPVHSGTKIVITSTERSFATLGAPLDLDVYDRPESVQYLCRATGIEDREGAAAVAEDLGDLPLALTQAAATITTRHLDYTGYRQLLANPLPRALTRLAGHGHPRRVDTAILLSIATAESVPDDPELTATVSDLLELIAMLSPAGVATSILPAQNGRRDEAVARCVQSNLLTSSADGSSVDMHRLVARVIRERADTDHGRARLLLKALDTIETHLFDISHAWSRRGQGADLIDHIEAITSTNLSDRVPDGTSRLFAARSWAGLQLLAAADATRAIDYTRRTLTDSEHTFGADATRTLLARADLASAYRAAGQVSEAINLFEQALTGCERALGADHPDTLTVRNNLAYAYESAGRLTDATRLYEQTLTDSQRVFGPDRRRTLTARGDLAYAYALAERLPEAITLFEQTLTDTERVYGCDHPDTILSRGDLAYAYALAGQLTDAIGLYEQTLAESERIHGNDHPHTLTIRNNLASAYASAGQLPEGIALYEQNLADRERLLGPDHPHTRTARDNLTHAYSLSTTAAVTAAGQDVSGGERHFDTDHAYRPDLDVE